MACISTNALISSTSFGGFIFARRDKLWSGTRRLPYLPCLICIKCDFFYLACLYTVFGGNPQSLDLIYLINIIIRISKKGLGLTIQKNSIFFYCRLC